MNRVSGILLILAVTVAITVQSAPTSVAHDADTWFGATWDTSRFGGQLSGRHPIRYWTVGNFTSTQRNRVTEAAAEVSKLHSHLNFEWGGQTTKLNGCGLGSTYNFNPVYWQSSSDNFLAVARVCTSGLIGHRTIESFEVQYNTRYHNEGAFSYVGQSSTPPTDKYHFVGTAIHEFLHGVGFGIRRDPSHFQDGTSICPQTSSRQIMCAPARPGINRGAPRTHDAHTTTSAYNTFR